GILAAVALPAYTDYTRKAKVSEVVLAASAARTCVSEIVQSAPILSAATYDSCGSTTTTQYVTGVTVGSTDGIISAAGVVDSITIGVTLTPNIDTTQQVVTTWTCQGTPPSLMPGSCRS
ncbi:MAG: pilin, partial [Anaerolineae bacterium]|nr:pilin [Anaerolineae bacterium]